MSQAQLWLLENRTPSSLPLFKGRLALREWLVIFSSNYDKKEACYSQTWFLVSMTDWLSIFYKRGHAKEVSENNNNKKNVWWSMVEHYQTEMGSIIPHNRGWDGWMASLIRWTWVWVTSESWWWTERPGVLRFTGSQRVGHDWATELNWTELNFVVCNNMDGLGGHCAKLK